MNLSRTVLHKVVTPVFCLVLTILCIAVLFGCSSEEAESKDVTSIQGCWQVQNTDVTVVFTDTQYKQVGLTYTYKLDTDAKTITYFDGEAQIGAAKYTLSDDAQTLTLVEQSDDNTDKTTVFTKVSDDSSALPSVGGQSENGDTVETG